MEGKQIFFADVLTELAQLELKSERLKSEISRVKYTGDPAWRILLELYISQQGKYKIQTTYLIEQAHLSHATGSRWLWLLVDQGLVKRVGMEGDQRSKLVELTAEGRNAVESYLTALRALIEGLQVVD